MCCCRGASATRLLSVCVWRGLHTSWQECAKKTAGNTSLHIVAMALFCRNNVCCCRKTQNMGKTYLVPRSLCRRLMSIVSKLRICVCMCSVSASAAGLDCVASTRHLHVQPARCRRCSGWCGLCRKCQCAGRCSRACTWCSESPKWPSACCRHQ